jgi:hypothetical protein
MSFAKVLVGALITENDEAVELFANADTDVISYREEGEIRREIGSLYVNDPMELQDVNGIIAGLTAGSYGADIVGVIHCKKGLYKLTREKAQMHAYGTGALIGDAIDVDYNVEADDQEYD